MGGNSGGGPTHINKDSSLSGTAMITSDTGCADASALDTAECTKVYLVTVFPSKGGKSKEHLVYSAIEGGSKTTLESACDGASAVGDVVVTAANSGHIACGTDSVTELGCSVGEVATKVKNCNDPLVESSLTHKIPPEESPTTKSTK